MLLHSRRLPVEGISNYITFSNNPSVDFRNPLGREIPPSGGYTPSSPTHIFLGEAFFWGTFSTIFDFGGGVFQKITQIRSPAQKWKSPLKNPQIPLLLPLPATKSCSGEKVPPGESKSPRFFVFYGTFLILTNF